MQIPVIFAIIFRGSISLTVYFLAKEDQVNRRDIRLAALVVLVPKNADAWNNKGYSHGNSKRYDEAKECFDEAISINARLVDGWRNKGYALANLGKHDDAMKCFDKAIEISPESAYAWNSKGYYLMKYSKQYDKAIECFDKAIENKSDFAYPHYNKGYALDTLKRHDDAIKCFDKAIDIKPDFAYALNSKGCYVSKSKKYYEAIEYFDNAIRLDPKNADAWNNKGVALLGLKKYGEAISHFDKAIGLRTDSFHDAWYNKGLALNSLARYQEAIECFDEAFEIDNKEIMNKALYNKGCALSALERFEEAIECFSKFISVVSAEPKYTSIGYLHRGQCEYQLRHFTKSLADFKNIKDPDLDAQQHNNIGLCYYQLGRYEDAKDEFSKSMKSDEKLVEAYYNLAVMYNLENNNAKAKKYLEICIKINEGFSKARDAMAKLELTERSEWYSWWFSYGKGKKAIGIMLIAFMLTPFLVIALLIDFFISHSLLHVTMHTGLTSMVKNNATAIITGLITLVGLLIAVLLLPSLTKIKVGSILELDTGPLDSKSGYKNIKLDEPLLTIPPIPSTMALKNVLESYSMPLRSVRMPVRYPISVRSAFEAVKPRLLGLINFSLYHPRVLRLTSSS